MHRVIIDCDPGIDDALALLLACASAEIELLGVTAVAGNRPLPITAANACRILDAAGCRAVPVYAGCARPLAGDEPRSNLVHGEDGLGGAVLPTDREPLAEHAVDFLTRMLLDAESGTLTLIAIGPLTNLALAEVRQPGILRRVKALGVMGGAVFVAGNVTPAAEFNFYADALAAQIVMDSGADIRLFGLDVTGKALMPIDWIASFADIGTRCGAAVHAMLREYGLGDRLLHDVCPVAALLEPHLFSGQRCQVLVDSRPGPGHGESRAAALPHTRPGSTDTMVFTDVNCAALLALVRERIALLP
jgi:purine nucleosidase